MTFGEYIKARRLSLNKTQHEITGFAQAYISDIETGKKLPTKRETIEKLARGLQIPKDKYTWLLVYALLDHDPNDYFDNSTSVPGVNEHGIPQKTSTQEAEICVGASPEDIESLIGPPGKSVKFGVRMWWVYSDIGLKIAFNNDHVETVEPI